MNTTKKTMVALAMGALSGAAFAAAGDDVTWIATNNTQKSATWATVENWVDTNGVTLAAAPVSGENITLADVPAYPAHNSYAWNNDMFDKNMLGYQSISYPLANKSTIGNPTIGTLAGDVHHTLAFGKDGDVTSTTWDPAAKMLTVTLTDPSSFLGFWNIGDMCTTLKLPANAPYTPILSNLSIKHRPTLNVTNAEGKVVINTLYNSGAIAKTGAGALEIKSTAKDLSVVYVKAGKLILDGNEDNQDGKLEALLAKAALHLDASDSTSLVTETGADGLTSVTQWNDVRGGSNRYCAKTYCHTPTGGHQIRNSQPPFLSDDAKSPTGLTLVDFGARSVSEYPERGRTNCLLRIGKGDDYARVTGVREVFYAASAPKGSGSVQILGDTSAIHYMCSTSYAELLDGNYCDPAVRYGDIIHNRTHRSFNGYDASELKNLYTLGIGAGRDTAVGMLGSRQYYANCTGGSRMGEILLFTNDLTRAERLAVSRYLDRKWRTGDASTCDLTAVRLTDATTAIEVPEGRTAEIGTVHVASGNVLTKTGAGKLVIGKLYPANCKIDVQGGSVAFSGVTVTDTAVAANPYMHLDAATIDDDDVMVEDEITYVNQWKDVTYGADRKATSATVEDVRVSGLADVTPKKPKLVSSSLVGGKKVVDFGTYENGTRAAAWMKLPNWGSQNNSTYSGFMVIRPKSNNSAAQCFSSSYGMATHRDNHSALFSANYLNYIAGGMMCRVSGMVEDPLSSAALDSNAQFLVYSFSSATPFPINAIIGDKGGQSVFKNAGGFEVGEVLLYDRKLTEQEILSTEAYLMKKWLGTEQPTAVTIPEMTVDDENAVELGGDENMTISCVTGGNGEFVKDGEGLAVVSAYNYSNANAPSSIDVKAGGLTLALERSAAFFDEAKFHLDASKLDTLTYTVDDNGVTNVSVIADVRKNGFKATAVSDTLATVQPKLVTVEAVPGEGHYIQALDFGGYSWKTNDYVKLADTPSAAMKFSAGYTIKHAITVFADAHGAHQQSVLSSYYPNNSGHKFQRNWKNGQLYWADNTYGGVSIEGLKASSIVRNATGGAQLDGKALNNNVYTAISSDRFHIFDFIAEQNRTKKLQTWTEDLRALAMSYGYVKANSGTTWGYDYDLTWEDRGGQYMAEQIAFSRMLTVDEQAFMLSYLKSKWFGEVPDEWRTNALDTVSVAKDAQLMLKMPQDYSATLIVSALSGQGTISADATLNLTDTLDATVKFGATDCLNVLGDVALGKSITVNVAADLSAGRILAGRYPILTATNITGFEDATINLVIAPESGIKTGLASIVKEGNTLYLNVAKRGLIIIVR